MDKLHQLIQETLPPPETLFTQSPILISVMGMSPAIVTENVYAINHSRHKEKALEQLFVVTTSEGYKALERAYFTQPPEKNPLSVMLQENNWPQIDFGKEQVTVISDESGQQLNDVRNIQQHEAVANTIMQFVATHTAKLWTTEIDVTLVEAMAILPSDEIDAVMLPLLNQWCRNLPGFIDIERRKRSNRTIKIKGGVYSFTLRAYQNQIHTSLAGGRKSMSFFIGNMMNLLGRKGDELSHVLVSQQAEYCSNFFYPTKASKTLTPRIGDEFDASQETVSLAQIPFLRMAGEFQADVDLTRFNYSELIDFFNTSHAIPKISLHCLCDDNDSFKGNARHILSINGKALPEPIGDTPAAYLLTVFQPEVQQFIPFGRRKNWEKIHLLYLANLSRLVIGQWTEVEDIASWFDWLNTHEEVKNATVFMQAIVGNRATPHFMCGEQWNVTKIKANWLAGNFDKFGGVLAKLTPGKKATAFSAVSGKLKNILRQYLHPNLIDNMLPQQIDKSGNVITEQVQLPVGNVKVTFEMSSGRRVRW